VPSQGLIHGREIRSTINRLDAARFAMATITLRVLDGADRGRSYDELGTPVSIGREEGNSIQLNDERVSRFHLKIQEDRDKIVLTDLESTNGTKVNGEDIQLRILRHGDLISVGRSVLLYGSREQINRRLAELRGDGENNVHTLGGPEADEDAEKRADPGSDWAENLEIRETLHSLEPPELPEHLSPAQAAQMSELLEYLHNRIRALLESVKFKGPAERITLNFEQWQNLLDVQARLASYLRSIGEPKEPEG
jgi:pSer/pThr/pTyr-binding forkhead associated (FHA) protein